MDDGHLVTALHYVTLNPVRAGIVKRARDWPSSSARAHLAGKDDKVVTVKPALDRIGKFASFLRAPIDPDKAYAALRRAETVGRPIASAEWLDDLEIRTGRTLKPGKRGPKPKE